MSPSSSTAACLILRQDRRVVDRVLFAGAGVVVRAHLVELAVHLVGGSAGRALEDHVLEKMAHAGQRVRLVARAGLDEERHGRRVGVAVALGHHFQAVFERVTKKFQRAPPRLAGRASRR